MIGTDPLESALAEYLISHRLCVSSTWQLRHTVELFGRWLGRKPQITDLADGEVSRWLCSLEDAFSQRTVAGHRVNLLSLWRACAACGVCDPPCCVRREPKPAPMPIAWTLDELHRLLDACQCPSGSFRDGRGRAMYLTTLVRAAYDTGLRRSDLWQLERDQVRPDGTVVIRQHKTGHPHNPQLRQIALTGFQLLSGDRPLRCPYASTGAWYRFWESITQQAGIRPGCLQMIRRTGASYVERDQPGSATRYLGHRTPGMARHYVDLSIARPHAVLPPEI